MSESHSANKGALITKCVLVGFLYQIGKKKEFSILFQVSISI
jgi:hypothetical protein